jgi:hypothetical protein
VALFAAVRGNLNFEGQEGGQELVQAKESGNINGVEECECRSLEWGNEVNLGFYSANEAWLVGRRRRQALAGKTGKHMRNGKNGKWRGSVA